MGNSSIHSMNRSFSPTKTRPTTGIPSARFIERDCCSTPRQPSVDPKRLPKWLFMLWCVLSTAGGNWATTREQPKNAIIIHAQSSQTGWPRNANQFPQECCRSGILLWPFWTPAHFTTRAGTSRSLFARLSYFLAREDFTFRLSIEAWRRRWKRWEDMCVPSGRSIWYVYRV